MKKILTYALSFGMVALLSCRDDALNPVPGWDPGVHAFGIFADVPEPKEGANTRPNTVANAANFPVAGQATAKMNLKLRWVSLDNKLTVSKIEVFLDMIESYNDANGNPKTASLGGGGKPLTTFEPSAANRQWNTFSVTPADVVKLFGTATVKYDGTNAVPVFNNPKRPRPVGAQLAGATRIDGLPVAADRFLITWKLTTSDGQVFNAWNPESICSDPTQYNQASANCNLSWTVR